MVSSKRMRNLPRVQEISNGKRANCCMRFIRLSIRIPVHEQDDAANVIVNDLMLQFAKASLC